MLLFLLLALQNDPVGAMAEVEVLRSRGGADLAAKGITALMSWIEPRILFSSALAVHSLETAALVAQVRYHRY